MFSFLQIDSKLYKIMSKFVDIMLVNVLFIISSIPIVTIGAGISASYTVYYNYSVGETDQIINRYIRAFKKNFKQSTIIHILLFAIFSILIVNVMLFPYYDENLKWIVIITLIFLLVFFYLYSMVIYPYISKFHDSLKVASKNTVKILFANFFKILGSGIWIGLPLALMVVYPQTLALFLYYYLFIGFSLNFYINTVIVNKVLKKYIVE